jgi:hypothetical protein
VSQNLSINATAVAGSALTCFGKNGADTRIYYFDASNDLIELAWNDNGCSFKDITSNTAAAAPAKGSALACYGVNGTDSRVYYCCSSQHVIELGWNTAGQPKHWGSSDITQAAAHTPAPRACSRQ